VSFCFSQQWSPGCEFLLNQQPVLQEAAILGVLCFVMALVVLAFFSSVLLNIVDAVFMCYALDLDTQSVTKSEVHEVFSQVTITLPCGILAVA